MHWYNYMHICICMDFQNLHCMLQQLYKCPWPVHHPLRLQTFTIDPYSYNPHHSFTHIMVIHNVPVSPEALSISAPNSRRTCWLALLPMLKSFARPTHMTYIGQTISVPSKLLILYLSIMCSPDFHQLIFLNHNLPIIILHTTRTHNIYVFTLYI